MEIYLVGGAVRDELLGLKPRERDWVVVGSSPEEMLEKGFEQVGKDFPVFLHPETKEEYALARTEKKTGNGYNGFVCHTDKSVTLEEDLKRRDLTINAIAKDDSGNIIDPFNGKLDLENKCLRHVSDAFVEDPLRVLRVARFSAHLPEFTLDKKTLALLKEIVISGELNSLVPERVFAELKKVFNCVAPEKFLEVLQQCKALEVIFPEIARLVDVPQNAKIHPEIDTFLHLKKCLQAAKKMDLDAETMFAVFLHDLGKGLTKESDLPDHPEHCSLGIEPAKDTCKRLKVPASYKELAVLMVKYHTEVHKVESLGPRHIVQLLTYTDSYRREDRFKKILKACKADSRGRTGYEDCQYTQEKMWLRYLELTKGIDVHDLISKGFDGEQLKQAIYLQRVNIVKKWQQGSISA